MVIVNGKFYSKTFHKCENKCSGCMSQFETLYKFRRHENVCKTIDECQTTPKIVQTMYGSNTEPNVLAIDHGYVSVLPSNTNFIFYDIECVLEKTDVRVSKSVKTFSHKLLSIEANSAFKW